MLPFPVVVGRWTDGRRVSVLHPLCLSLFSHIYCLVVTTAPLTQHFYFVASVNPRTHPYTSQVVLL